MLEARGISKSYRKHRALHDLDLDIKTGSIFGLLGPNGAGKTTFIRIINQIIAPDAGELRLKGEKLNSRHIAKIGYLPEERGLYPKMKIGEQLLYLAQLKGLSKLEAQKRIKYWLERFELSDRRQAKVEELSKGLAQKVQFIASVIHEPELLILDEPFTGFDPVNTEHIKSEILRLNQEGATIIFSTHRMESVKQLCQDIALINKGEKLLHGNLQSVKNQFKKGWYRLEYRSEWQVPPGEDWLLEVVPSAEGVYSYRVNLNGAPGSELLNMLEASKLISFQEEIPSLNDIFIQSTRGHE